MKPLINIKTLAIGLLLLAILNACSHTDKPAKIAKSTPKAKQITTTEIKVSNDSLDSMVDPHTFVDCKLYAAADTNSATTARVAAMTALVPLGSSHQSGEDTIPGKNGQTSLMGWRLDFYKVRLPDNKEGFMLADNMARFVITDTAKQVQYYLGSYRAGKLNDFHFRVSKFARQTKKLLSHVELHESDLPEAEFSVYYIKGSYLKNVAQMIKVVGHNDYCGGNVTSILIADNNLTLTALPGNYTTLDDGGGVYTKLAYLPAIDSISRPVLKVSDERDEDSKPATLNYPEGINVPHDELVIQTFLEGQYYMNDNNEQVKLKNGQYKMETPLTLTTSYYRWDGFKLTKLPQKKKEAFKE